MNSLPLFSTTLKGKCSISDRTPGSENLRPMRRLAPKTLWKPVCRSADYDRATAVDSRVSWVHRPLALRSIADKEFGIGERDIGRGFLISLAIWNDINVIVPPNTDTTVWDEMSTDGSRSRAGDHLRVGGTQIDADGSTGHYSGTGFCEWIPV